MNIFLFFYIFLYFKKLTTRINYFLLISNFNEEIMYKITQINIVKRTISLLFIYYFLFLQHNVLIQKFSFIIMYFNFLDILIVIM